MKVMAIVCHLWVTGVETELRRILSITASGALQKLLSFTHTSMYDWMGLDGGSVTSNSVLHQQLPFTTPPNS